MGLNIGTLGVCERMRSGAGVVGFLGAVALEPGLCGVEVGRERIWCPGGLGVRRNVGCQRLISGAACGCPSLIMKWQARQVACALSWILKHGTPEMGRGNEWPSWRIGFLSVLA
ncbi:hypothetical protein AAFF_G00022620 [Aldrovandia affinis]|uniref:Uncharacterized protein n=1 Tax=Aldrovandia affinis TaxID=143900 RepID=A0AAD7T5D3_9TELE|nr:hypothetical protein AAFF_G00022620 [Aldrovandia affinis]